MFNLNGVILLDVEEESYTYLRKHGWKLKTPEEGYIAILRRDPCAYCGAPLGGTLDHIDPLLSKRSNSHRHNNLTGACWNCNQRKGPQTLLHYLAGDPYVPPPQEKMQTLLNQAGMDSRDALESAGWTVAATRLKEYRKEVRRDPCAFCGKPSNRTQLVRTRKEGGSPESTNNITGVCAECEQLRQGRNAIEYWLERRGY